jgi:hypothetical protein
MGNSPHFSIRKCSPGEERVWEKESFWYIIHYQRPRRRYSMKKLTFVALVTASLFALSGCATKTQTGALTGAAIGGIGGAMLGNSKTAAVGAAAGAVTGAIIGKQLEE